MIYQYNYNLKTGTVGTNDGNLASILYNINRLEVITPITSDPIELDDVLGEFFFMISSMEVSFDKFLKERREKTCEDTVARINSAFDNAFNTIREGRYDEEDENPVNAEQMRKAFSDAHKSVLDVVPDIVSLEEQTRCSV